MHFQSLDPRIGQLNSGQFYAFVDGYDRPETVGTLDRIEAALGLRERPTASPVASQKVWNVTLTFQYPAWDEVRGLVYEGIAAASKSLANAQARLQAARDGHLFGGKGRVTFKATEAQ